MATGAHEQHFLFACQSTLRFQSYLETVQPLRLFALYFPTDSKLPLASGRASSTDPDPPMIKAAASGWLICVGVQPTTDSINTACNIFFAVGIQSIEFDLLWLFKVFENHGYDNRCQCLEQWH